MTKQGNGAVFPGGRVLGREEPVQRLRPEAAGLLHRVLNETQRRGEGPSTSTSRRPPSPSILAAEVPVKDLSSLSGVLAWPSQEREEGHLDGSVVSASDAWS